MVGNPGEADYFVVLAVDLGPTVLHAYSARVLAVGTDIAFRSATDQGVAKDRGVPFALDG